MSRYPRKSPWGDVKRCGVLYKGIFSVRTSIERTETEEHGGIMVRLSSVKYLSEAAQKCGFRKSGYLCFEKERHEAVVIRELLDKNLWEIPAYICDKEMYEEKVNRSLQKHQPDYWGARQKRLPLSERLKDGAVKAADHNTDAGRAPDTATNKQETR